MDGDPSTVNLDPYRDPVGYLTIGWGHLIQLDGRALRAPADRALARQLYPNGLARDEAEALLTADLIDAARDVRWAITVPLTEGQLSALISFTFNLGLSKVRGSTLYRLVNARDFARAGGEFGKWVHAGGRRLRGLVNRRAAERALFVA